MLPTAGADFDDINPAIPEQERPRQGANTIILTPAQYSTGYQVALQPIGLYISIAKAKYHQFILQQCLFIVKPYAKTF
jgi:hypothetical protein